MTECVFCINPTSNLFTYIEPDRVLKEYNCWWLLLQREDKLKSTKQAAGLLVSKKHTANVTDTSEDAAIELFSVVKESAQLLCEKVGTTYSGQETVGFNQGVNAGQTVMHAHVHILPVCEEDPIELMVRSGIGGAFEALRKERIGD